MFRKILVANRGEIAVRVINTCREMNIPAVAVYEAAERDALHVRCADEALLLDKGFGDAAALIEIAQRVGADAIHPGYGFLAEEAGFIRACNQAGIAFIGGSAEMMDVVHNKVGALETARAAGFRTATSSMTCESDFDEIHSAAQALGYPLIVKSCYGGRGPGTRLVRGPQTLESRVRSAQAESHAVFGNSRIFLEKALLPANQVGVQILADKHGSIIHLGDRDGSWQYNNHRMIEEAPSPCLSEAQRQSLCATALAIARLFNLENAATVEFLIDGDGAYYFTEIKARIQTEHPLTELLTGVDLVREQIRIAAGEPLTLTQDAVRLTGHAIMCRIHAEDPLNRMRSSPGHVEEVRLPTGGGIRIDTYLFPGCNVPELYGSLIAKLMTWGQDRAQAVSRIQRALIDFAVTGVPTDRTFTLNAIRRTEFATGHYSTETGYQQAEAALPDAYYRELAALVGVLYVERFHNLTAVIPERVQSGWHQSSRRLPE